MKQNGLTLVELLVVIAVIAILASMLPVSLGGGKHKSQRIQCVNNLKSIGTAYRLWSSDCGDSFPAGDKQAGWQNLLANPNQGSMVWTNYKLLCTPLGGDSDSYNARTVICPADERTAARDLSKLQNINISYFVGAGANDIYPASFLGGDRNLSPGTIGKNDYGYSPRDGRGNDVIISTNANESPICWSQKMHSDGNPVGAGNILLGDGSVQQCSSARLRTDYQPTAADSGNLPPGITNTNSIRLIFP